MISSMRYQLSQLSRLVGLKVLLHERDYSGIASIAARRSLEAFDALPRPIRDALQDGVSPLCRLKVRAVLRVNHRTYGETEAIERVLQLIAEAQAKAVAM
jgi:hypothetical protein